MHAEYPTNISTLVGNVDRGTLGRECQRIRKRDRTFNRRQMNWLNTGRAQDNHYSNGTIEHDEVDHKDSRELKNELRRYPKEFQLIGARAGKPEYKQRTLDSYIRREASMLGSGLATAINNEKKPGRLRLVHANVNGLRGKAPQVRNLIAKYDTDIIGLSETHLLPEEGAPLWLDMNTTVWVQKALQWHRSLCEKRSCGECACLH